jgi:serine/threonine protein kinase
MAATDLARVGGQPALVRNWVEGVDLGSLVRRLAEHGTDLPSRAVCELLAQAAVALEIAEAGDVRGMPMALPRFHGDLKPSNVVLGSDGCVHLLDIGCGATALGRDVSGTPAARFLDPTGRAGPAADIYALGRLGMELFGGAELLSTTTSEAHDRGLRRLVGRLELQGIAPADVAALRTLVARCMSWSAQTRPSATQASALLFAIADRSTGPGLASFSSSIVRSWMFVPPAAPDGAVRSLTVTPWQTAPPEPQATTVTEEYPSVTDHLRAADDATTARIPAILLAQDELTIRLPRPGRSARILIMLTGLFAGFAVMTCMGSSLLAAALGAWEAGLLG